MYTCACRPPQQLQGSTVHKIAIAFNMTLSEFLDFKEAIEMIASFYLYIAIVYNRADARETI